MRYRRKFEFSPKLLLIFLSAICGILLTVSVMYKDVVKPFTNVVAFVVVPMQNGINTVGGWAGDHLGDFRSMKQLKKENAELKERVEQLTEVNQRLEVNASEAGELAGLLKLDEEYKDYKKIGARVISKGSGNWYETFVINKGTKDGVEVDMNVLSGTGLVGIVEEAGINYAKVRSIMDDDTNVSARSAKSKDTCVVKGNSQMMQESGTIEVQYISKDAEMQNGEKLYTSHISSRYLPGLLIGTISDITMDSTNLTKSGKVTPVVDFTHIQQVLVITQKKEVPKGSEKAD